MLTEKLLATVAALAMGASATAASATTYSYTGYSTNGVGINITGPNPTGSALATQITLTGPEGDVQTWCVDTTTYLAGAGTYTVLPSSALLSMPPPSGVPSGLTWTQVGEIGWLKLLGDETLPGSTDAANWSAAFSIAIWTVEYAGVDGGFTYTGGNSTVDGYVSDLLGAIDGGDYTPFYGFHVLEAAGNQTLITDSIPEPSTWAMMALGFAGLGFAGYRKVKAKAAFG